MNFYSMVYPLKFGTPLSTQLTQWCRCGELCPHTILLRHYGCLMVSYLAYWCLVGGGGELRPHLHPLLRQWGWLTVTCLAGWRGGGGWSTPP